MLDKCRSSKGSSDELIVQWFCDGVQDMIQQGFVRLENYLNDMRAEQAADRESVLAQLQVYKSEVKSLHIKQEIALRDQMAFQLLELEQMRDSMSLELQQLADKQRVLDQEHQQLHPFFRFMQDPHLQSQLAELEQGSDASVSSRCRVFYCSLKVYLAAYLMNTKMLADEVLRDSSTQVRDLVIGGLQAVISCACNAVPGGGLIEAVTALAGKAVKENHKQDVKKQLLNSGHVSSFSLMEAEHLAQLLSLFLTKCFSCQLDQLTDSACKDLARDAVGRITVSLCTAFKRLEQAERDLPDRKATSATSSPAAVSSSAGRVTIGSAAVSPVAITVNRLCELFLIAVRLPVHELKLEALWKTKHQLLMPAIHPADQRSWTSDGLFNRSGVAVPCPLPQSTAQLSTTVTASPSVLPVAVSTVSPASASGGASQDALALLLIPFDFWRTTLQVRFLT